MSVLADPVSRTTLVADWIRHEILSGAFEPGHRLVERELADRLGLSKTPVREALKTLATSGLVVNTAYRATCVRRVDRELAHDVYQMRAILEPEAVRQAVAGMPEHGVDAARRALDDATAAAQFDDRAALSLANRGFHQSLYGWCKNDILRTTLDDMQDLTALVSVSVWRQQQSWEGEAREHRRILAAVEKGDAERAHDLVRAHILRFLERVPVELDQETQ